MITKAPSRHPNKVRVRFQLPPAIWADQVHLVGDFNGWSRTSHPLTCDRNDGSWYITLELERGHRYEFRYLVNGREWHNDWKADEYVANPYGATNSVVIAELPKEEPPLPEAEPDPAVQPA